MDYLVDTGYYLLMLLVGGVVSIFLNLLPWALLAGGTYCLYKIKKEWIPIVLIIVLWICNAFIYTRNNELWKISRQNMENALRHSAVMLKSGEQEQLYEKLTILLESQEFEKGDAYEKAAAFARTLGVETLPQKHFPSIIWAVILCVVLLGWFLMWKYGLKDSTRRWYLAAATVLASVVFLTAFISKAVRIGYSHYAWDVTTLAQAVSSPNIHPELLPMLEEPKRGAFGYMRVLPEYEPPREQ